MENKRAFIFCGFCCLWLGVFFPADLLANVIDVEVVAESALLIDGDSGAVLFEKNSDVMRYPASTTKVATALYALHRLGSSLEVEVVAGQDAIASITPQLAQKQIEGKLPAHWIVVGSTHIGIKRGEALPLTALFYGMLVCSGGDAANVIAEHVSGSVPKFVKEMNLYLKEIGCKSTHFTNPHGYHHPDHYTTACDMALIARKAMEHPFFREVVKSPNYLRPETNKQPSQMLLQSNMLLKKGKHYYPFATGIKTGYHSLAGHNLLAAASNGKRNLIAVLLQTPARPDPCRDAIKLFDAAFAEKRSSKRMLKKGPQKYARQIPGGRRPLRAALQNDLLYTFFPSEEAPVKAQLTWDEGLKPPIAAGQRVGKVCLMSPEGVILQEEPVYADEEVAPALLYSLKQHISKGWSKAQEGKGKIALGCGLLIVAMGLLWGRRGRQ